MPIFDGDAFFGIPRVSSPGELLRVNRMVSGSPCHESLSELVEKASLECPGLTPDDGVL